MIACFIITHPLAHLSLNMIQNVESIDSAHTNHIVSVYINLRRDTSTYHIGRASTNPQPVRAPAAKSGAAHASKVAPVVQMSSIITTVRPTKAPVAYAG